MGFLTNLWAGPSDAGRSSYPPDHDFWYSPLGGMMPHGVIMTPELAMRVSVIFRCIDNIASDIASVPCQVFRWLPDGGKERATGHPLFDVLRRSPNVQQTAFEFWQMMIGHLLLRGNAYAEIVAGPRGFADQLVPLHPGRMSVEPVGNGRVRYKYTKADGTTHTYVQDEIFHLRGLSSDGIVGLSVISMAASGLYHWLAMEHHDTRFFKQNAQPGGVLTTEQTLEKDTASAISEQWQKLHGGVDNAHKVAVLEQGLKFQQIGMSARDSQFVETKELTTIDLCRWYRMPPHKVMHLKDAHYTNIEAQNIEYVTGTVRPWVVSIEQAISRALILQPATYFAEFNLDAIMRGDAASRVAYYRHGILDGWLTRNEARAKENLNPAEGLGEFLEPRNMAPAGSQESASGDPVKARYYGGPAGVASPRLAVTTAERILRKEIKTLQTLAERHASDASAWRAGVTDFYDDHVAFVMQTGCLHEDRALAYVARQRRAVLSDGIGTVDGWLERRGPALAAEIADAGLAAAA